jgi:hypothetical protein
MVTVLVRSFCAPLLSVILAVTLWLPGGSKLYLAVMPKPLLVVLAAGNYVFFSAVQLK